MLPSSVSKVGAHYGDLQAQIVAEALAMLDQALRRGRSSPESWRDAVQSIGNRLLLLQVQTATYADAYLNDILEAQGADPSAEGRVNPQAWSDRADGGGSWLQGLVYAPNSVRLPGVDWWSRFQFVAGSIVKTGLGDAARGSVQAGMQARPAVKDYVRMVRGKSCARCVILAGKHYRSSVAFKRHRRCDCINIPAAENARDWATNPKDYFHSLDTAEQDRLFTKAGAQAIRAGADMAQVVNVRQGITVAEAYGQKVAATTVGTTRRGLAGQRLAGTRLPRLLPDEIFLQAERLGWDRAEVLRQLKRFAYIV